MEGEQRVADGGKPFARERARLGTECWVGQLDDVALRILERIGGPADGSALDVVTAVDGDPEKPGPDGLPAEHRDPDVGAKEGLLDNVGRVRRGPENPECHRVELILVTGDNCCKGIAVAAACPLEERLVVHALESTRGLAVRFPAASRYAVLPAGVAEW